MSALNPNHHHHHHHHHHHPAVSMSKNSGSVTVLSAVPRHLLGEPWSRPGRRMHRTFSHRPSPLGATSFTADMIVPNRPSGERDGVYSSCKNLYVCSIRFGQSPTLTSRRSANRHNMRSCYSFTEGTSSTELGEYSRHALVRHRSFYLLYMCRPCQGNARAEPHTDSATPQVNCHRYG